MASDISTQRARNAAGAAPVTFEEFHATHGAALAQALVLGCNDVGLATTALDQALLRTCRAWKRVRTRTDVVGWAFNAGLEHANKGVGDQAPVAMNHATGGYLRGLSLPDAIAALPLPQRFALVAAHFWGWSDDRAEAAMGINADAISTRRTRAINFVAHHLQSTPDEAVIAVADRLQAIATAEIVDLPDARMVRRRARTVAIRNRAGASLLAALVIAGGATSVRVARQAPDPVATGPEPIAAPGNSSGWLPPIADGSGGFMALDTSGASRFASSADGLTWFEHALWNSRAVDLRTEVTSFSRTGDRYVATLEAVSGIQTSVPPRIATSNDLATWRIQEIEIDLVDGVEGLQFKPEIVQVAAAGSRVIAAIEIVESVDYRALGTTRNDVCVEVTFDAVQALYLCDGEVLTIDRPSQLTAVSTSFWLSEAAGSYVQVSLPEGSDSRSLVSYGHGFAIADFRTGRVSVSDDGTSWAPVPTLETSNRFVLIEGDQRGRALAVVPNKEQWQAGIFEGGETGVVADVGLTLDPATVWTKPELVAGPAGWALFVTTSRTWERGDVNPGWAVDTGDWVVSRLPDSDVVTVQDQSRNTVYRFAEASDSLQIADDGAVVLELPDGNDSLIQISRAEIDQSRSAATDQNAVKAQVFFSADGQSWRSIWETTEDTWFGSVAVGDDEVLITGTSLTGGPISVPVHEG